MRIARLLVSLGSALAMAAAGCGTSTSPEPTPTPAERVRIVIPGVGVNGVFDPAPASDSTTLWMSYTEVTTHPTAAQLPMEGTRIARSDDSGATWTDVARVNLPMPTILPPPNDTVAASWVHEVSRLAYNPWGPPGGRWILLWHHYLNALIGGTHQRLFDNGWIALRTASSPDSLWSAERKLFTGSIYNPASDALVGPPEFPLNLLFPTASQLGACLTFTEPAVLPRAEGVYVAVKCASSTLGKISLLRCAHDFSGVEYLGDLLFDNEAALFDPAWSGFSAPELVETATKTYVVVSPTENPGDIYRGCLVFEVSDLPSATLVRSGGAPTLVSQVQGDEGTFNGACGYSPAATKAGIIYGQVFPAAPPEFRIFRTGVTLP